jgi:hypothetical protein
MIENKLSHQELAQFLRPFLHLEPLSEALPSLQAALGFPIASQDDICIRPKLKITFEGYEIAFDGLEFSESGRLWYVDINFRCKQKWWNALLSRNQNAELLRALQTICHAEMPGVVFSRHRKIYQLTGPGWKQYDVEVAFLYDNRSYDFSDGLTQVSPLEISNGVDRDWCFVNFKLNATAYQHSSAGTFLTDSARTTSGIGESAHL